MPKLAQKTQQLAPKPALKKLLTMLWMLPKAKLMPWAQQPSKQPKKQLMPPMKPLMPLKKPLTLPKKQLSKLLIDFRKRAVLGRPFFLALVQPE